MTTRPDFSELAATGIHELKNLVGELTLLLDGLQQDAPPAARAQLASARFVCGRIRDRMAALLTLYKLDGGHKAFALEAHSPADFLEDVAAELVGVAGMRFEVRTEVSPDLPAFWFFDRELVRAALINAGHNALAHARGMVSLTAKTQDGWLVFSVADDGAGYSRALLEADLSEPRRFATGSGLGLYFAQVAAAAHTHAGRQGYVQLANAAAGGAVFSLFLP